MSPQSFIFLTLHIHYKRVIPFHDSLQREIPQAFSQSSLTQFHISPTGDAREVHEWRRTLLSPTTWVCPWTYVHTHKTDIKISLYCICSIHFNHVISNILCYLYIPERNRRSTRSDLGMGLRIWRGDRVLGVEAGELGSGGSSGWGYPLWTSTSEAHIRHTLCRQGSTMGCLTMSLQTGHCNSCSILFILDWI